MCHIVLNSSVLDLDSNVLDLGWQYLLRFPISWERFSTKKAGDSMKKGGRACHISHGWWMAVRFSLSTIRVIFGLVRGERSRGRGHSELFTMGGFSALVGDDSDAS